MFKSVITVVLLLTCFVLYGQTYDTEFYPGTEWGDPRELSELEADGSVFTYPAWSAPDPFRNFSRYRFGAVRYRERGLDSRHFKVLLGGIDLSDNLSSYPDWSLITLARRSGLAAAEIPAMVAGTSEANIARSDYYSLKAQRDEFYMLLRGSDRYMRAGMDIRTSHKGRRGWSHLVAATGQFGPDGHISGVRSDEAGGVLSLTKEWEGGASLTFFAAGDVSDRGVRTAATEEAFSLTGDNLYNPNWGRQNGRVRNSRQTRVRQLFTALSLEAPLGKSRTLSLTLAFRNSLSGRTRLAWYDAHSPMPDYYRSMPSYFPDWSASDIIADAWRANDPTVTQLDWNALYYNNTLSADGRATYIVEERVEHSRDLHLNLAIDRRIGTEFDISYGVGVRRDGSRFFKVADDMLGAEWVPNIDQYVTDDDGEYHTAPPNENDLQNPGRQVRQGDRFGYDYAVTRFKPSIFGTVRWNRANGGLAVSGRLAHTRLRREGFYEKELFPGEASLGLSPVAAFTTYSIGGSAYLNFGGRHSLSVSALAGTEAPYAGELFLSAEQNNLMVADAVPSGLYGGELSWAVAGEAVDLRVTGFVNSMTGETDVRQYYDDLSSTFADMVVRGVDRLSYGVEAGMEARLARWLTFSAGGSIGEYRYNSEPTATLHSDATGEVISEGIVCYMSGLHTGLPQMVAAAELAYSDRRYLRFSLSGEWAGGRYVEINPLYHSSRITGINSAPEIMDLFTSQERLPDAFTLGMSLSKGFVLKRGYLRIAGSVRNLLSSTIIHSGYEQMRIMRRGSGSERTLVPFPSKYMYSYPLTWSLTLSYRL